jgi:hypothetical protein
MSKPSGHDIKLAQATGVFRVIHARESGAMLRAYEYFAAIGAVDAAEKALQARALVDALAHYADPNRIRAAALRGERTERKLADG